jgi:hypothetical protein
MDTEKQLEIPQEQPGTLQKIAIPPLPTWPTSKRGPKTTEPPPGTRRMHLRTEQTVELNYDQERGKPLNPEERRDS